MKPQVVVGIVCAILAWGATLAYFYGVTKSISTSGVTPIRRAPFHLSVDRPWFRKDWQFVKLPADLTSQMDSRRFLIQRYNYGGLGNFIRALTHLFYAAPKSQRYLLMDCRAKDESPDPAHQSIYDFLVPRGMAWNVTPIADRLLPLDVRGDPKFVDATCSGPIFPPWSYGTYYHPTLATFGEFFSNKSVPIEVVRNLRNFIWESRFAELDPNQQIVNFDIFPEADGMFIPRSYGKESEFLDLYRNEEFKVEIIPAGHFAPSAYWRRSMSRQFRHFNFPTEFEAIAQMSRETQLVLERTILRTFFLFDSEAPEDFENQIKSGLGLGTWQLGMLEFMRDDVKNEKKQFLINVIDGLTQFVPMGSLSHCKSSRLMPLLRERLESFQENPLGQQFADKFNFSLTSIHFRMGDHYDPQRKNNMDRRLGLSRIVPCVQKVLKRDPTVQMMLISDRPEARRMALDSQNGQNIIVPLVPEIDHENLHFRLVGGDRHGSKYRATFVEWMLLVVADRLVITSSTFGGTAKELRGNDKSGFRCK